MNNQLSLHYPEVLINNGKVVTTSIAIAGYFQKTHDNVLKKIRSVIDDCDEKYHLVNFNEVVREVPGGDGAVRKMPMFELTRDGFVLIAMGFTGKKALQWKINYINAFNRMETELNKNLQDNLTYAEVIYVDKGKVVRTQRLEKDELVASIEHFMQIARKAGYIVVSPEELLEKLVQ